MYSNAASFEDIPCMHARKFLDRTDDFAVCQDCGKILDPQQAFFQAHQNGGGSYTVFEEALNVCHRMFIPPIFAQDIKFFYLKTSPYFSYDPVLFGACLYEWCKREEIFRTLKECASIVGVTERQINLAHGKYFEESDPLLPSNLAPRIAQICGLNRKQAISLQSGLLRAEKLHSFQSYSPMTILGAFIYLYARHNTLDITLKDISEACGLSVNFIYRFLKFLKSKSCLSSGKMESE